MPRIRYDMDGKVREHEFVSLRLKEARYVQRVTKLTPQAFGNALEEGDPNAITALVAILELREGRQLRFDDIDLDLGTFEVEPLESELEALAEVEAETPTDPAEEALEPPAGD